MAKKRQSNSRAARWARAVAKGQEALSAMEEHAGALEEALTELEELKDEYQGWYDNMPEGLQQSPTGEKLQEVTNLDFEYEDPLEAMRTKIDDAEGVDLPLGWGKD